MPPRGEKRPHTSMYLGAISARRSLRITFTQYLMKVAMVTEAEEVELERLALHHAHVRDILDRQGREIRLSGVRQSDVNSGQVKVTQ
jgi:hypothetical protein